MAFQTEQHEVQTISPEDTMALAAVLGRNLRGGEVIELLSDLGGGKTTFTKGLVKGTGSSELVSSPSFTLCNQYIAPKFTIYHFDLYRLNDPGIILQELLEVAGQPDSVAVVEWPEVIEDSLIKSRVRIEITADTENSRKIKISAPQELAYITQDLK